MNPYDKYVEDNDELVMSGKQIRKYRDICRSEGYKQCLEDCLNIVTSTDEIMVAFEKIGKLKEGGLK